MLVAVLKYGRESENEKNLKSYCERYVTPGWVASEIDLNYYHSYYSDLGYGWILESIIKDVISKSHYISKPNFSADPETYKGAIQREEWITETVLNSIMEDEANIIDFSGRLKPLLKENGISEILAEQAEDAIFQGGLKAAQKLQGIDFHMIVEQVSKLVVQDIGKSLCEDPITGDLCEKPIEETQKRWLEMISRSVFISLPLNGHSRCEYDKLIPAIFIIGVSRLANPDNNEKPTAPKNEEQGSGHFSKNFKLFGL